jgi:hypothetical protein
VKCAALVGQQTLDQGLPPRDRVRSPVTGDDLALFRDEAARAVWIDCRPLLWRAWVTGRRRVVARALVAGPLGGHDATLSPPKRRVHDPSTVSNHLTSIYHELGVRSYGELVEPLHAQA